MFWISDLWSVIFTDSGLSESLLLSCRNDFLVSLTLYCVLLLVSCRVSVAVLWFALPAVGYALLLPAVGVALLLPAVGVALLLPADGFALLPAVGFALLGSFHRFSPSRRLSAALGAHRHFDVLLAVLVPVLLYFVLLFTTDFLAMAPSVFLSHHWLL